MQMTMRWFGPQEDKIPLEYIRQVPGVEGVVGALYDVAPGEVWPVEKLKLWLTSPCRGPDNGSD